MGDYLRCTNETVVAVGGGSGVVGYARKLDFRTIMAGVDLNQRRKGKIILAQTVRFFA